jgi:hypothetical protein
MAFYKPTSNQDFIETLAKEGALQAYINSLPLPALIACACGESAYGTSEIYTRTGCPFNLQKPREWKFPQCQTMPLDTINKDGERPKTATFCVATSLGDASRLWCEWVLHWPNPRVATLMQGFSGDAKEFARNLHLVCFAEGKKAKTERFAQLIDEHNLLQYDARAIAKEIYGLG